MVCALTKQTEQTMVCARTKQTKQTKHTIEIFALARTNVPLSSEHRWTLFHHPKLSQDWQNRMG